MCDFKKPDALKYDTDSHTLSLSSLSYTEKTTVKKLRNGDVAEAGKFYEGDIANFWEFSRSWIVNCTLASFFGLQFFVLIASYLSVISGWTGSFNCTGVYVTLLQVNS